MRFEPVALADSRGEVVVRDDGFAEKGLSLRDGDGREEGGDVERGGGGGAEVDHWWGDGLDPVDAAAAEVGDRDGSPGRRVVAVVEPEGELEDDLVGGFCGELVVSKVRGAEGGDCRVDQLVLLLEVVIKGT